MSDKINLLKDTVFFSSTFRDFQEARSKILLGFQNMEISVEAMENFNATVTPPILECIKRLEDSQIYLLVIGKMYGTIDKESGLSITEIEYNHALELHGRGIIKDLWIFKPTPEYVAEPEHKDTDEEKIEKLKKFRNKVCKSHTPRHYDNLDDLKSQIYLQCYVSLKQVTIPLLEKAGISDEGIRKNGNYESKEIQFVHEKKQLPLSIEETQELELQINEMNKILKAIGKDEIQREKLDVKSVTMLGNYYYVKQEFGNAKEMYNLVLRYFPDDPRALNNKGSALRAEFEREEACKLFERASELDPNYTDPKVNLGGILCELNRADEGLKILDQVYKIEKENADVALLLNIGFAHSKLNNNKVAHEFYDQAEKVSPKDTLVLMNIATLYQGEKNYIKAIEYADKILAIEKKHPQALSTKGSSHLDLEHLRLGIIYLEESLKIEPKELTTLVNLALGYRRLHDYSRGNTWYADFVEMYANKALEINENDILSLDHIGWCYNRCGKAKESILFFNKALEITPNHSGILMDKVGSLLQLEEFGEVLKIINHIIENNINEGDLQILSLKYNLLLKINKIEEADKFIDSLKSKLNTNELEIVKTQRPFSGRVITT